MSHAFTMRDSLAQGSAALMLAHTWYLRLIARSAPGQIRTCDTRFRRSTSPPRRLRAVDLQRRRISLEARPFQFFSGVGRLRLSDGVLVALAESGRNPGALRAVLDGVASRRRSVSTTRLMRRGCDCGLERLTREALSGVAALVTGPPAVSRVSRGTPAVEAYLDLRNAARRPADQGR